MPLRLTVDLDPNDVAKLRSIVRELVIELVDELRPAGVELSCTQPDELRAKYGVGTAALETDPPPAEPEPEPAEAPTNDPATNLERVRQDFASHPGAWRGIKDVAQSTGLTRESTKTAVVKLRDRNEIEHNGKPSRSSAYRWRGQPAESPATATREQLIATGVIKPATPDRVRGASRPVNAKPPDHNRTAAGSSSGGPTIAGTAGTRKSALAGPPMPQTSPIAPPTPPAVSAKTRKALEAEQRDGPRGEVALSALAASVLEALEREPGTARELAGRLVRNTNDVAVELTALERTHPQLLTRMGRAEGGRIIYGRSEVPA